MHYEAQNLSGKVALVTGAGRGIGRAVALELARHGASVAVNFSSSSEAANDLAHELTTMGVRATAIKADLTKVEEIECLFHSVINHFGRVDIVVSNSGKEKFVPLGETTVDDFHEVLNLNTRGQFFIAKHAFEHIQPGGRLVLMSSIAASIGVAGHALYAGSKAAVEGFTRCLARDFGEKRCTVNAIAPAGVKTDMWATNSWRYAPGCDAESSIPEIEASLAKGSPLNRCGAPQDIGRVVAFLVSPEGEWINGQIIHVNGGANI